MLNSTLAQQQNLADKNRMKYFLSFAHCLVSTNSIIHSARLRGGRSVEQHPDVFNVSYYYFSFQFCEIVNIREFSVDFIVGRCRRIWHFENVV